MTTQPTYMTQRHVKAGAWFNHEVWQQFREHLASSVNFRLGFFFFWAVLKDDFARKQTKTELKQYHTMFNRFFSKEKKNAIFLCLISILTSHFLMKMRSLKYLIQLEQPPYPINQAFVYQMHSNSPDDMHDIKREPQQYLNERFLYVQAIIIWR